MHKILDLIHLLVIQIIEDILHFFKSYIYIPPLGFVLQYHVIVVVKEVSPIRVFNLYHLRILEFPSYGLFFLLLGSFNVERHGIYKWKIIVLQKPLNIRNVE